MPELLFTNALLDAYLGLPSEEISPFYVGTIPLLNAFRIFQQGDLGTVSVETIAPDNFVDITTSLETLPVLLLGKSTTVNKGQEDSYKTSSYYLQKREILDRFDVLAQREDNWDGYESKRPSQSALNHAKFLLIDEMLDTIISAGYPWRPPFISSDEDGYMIAEWYEGERELHLLIGENEAEYLQIWGTNIDNEMHDDFLSRDNYLMLWEWLLYE